MTKKDYELIASAIASDIEDVDNIYSEVEDKTTRWDTLNELAYTMAQLLQADNPRFDRVRFLKACGVVLK